MKTTLKAPERLVAPALVAVTILLAYAPQLFLRFAFSDDYAYMANHGYRPINPYLIGDGRPLGGFLAHLFFSAVDRVSTAWVLRAIGMAQIIAVAIVVLDVARRSGIGLFCALFLSIAFATMPSIQAWVPWGVAAWQLPALVLSALSFYPAAKLLDPDGGIRPGPAILLFLLTLTALHIYQPFATFAWPLMLLYALAQRSERGFRLLVVFAVVFAAAALVYFGLFKLVWLPLTPPEHHHERAAVLSLSQMPEKVLWFLRGPVLAAFTPLQAYGRLRVAIPLLILSGVGLWLSRKTITGFLVWLVIAAATLFMAHLPSLATAESTPIRTQISVSFCALALVVLGGYRLSQRLRLDTWKLDGLLAIVSVAFLLVASATVMQLKAWPQSLELFLIEQRLRESRFPERGTLVLIGSPDRTPFNASACDPDIACSMTTYQWILPNLTRLWLRDRGVTSPGYAILYVRSKDDKAAISFTSEKTTVVPVPPDAAYIDFSGIAGPKTD